MRWPTPGRNRSGALALLFAVTAVVFAAVRYHDTTIVVPGSEIRFSFLSDMRWDPGTRLLTRTGGDPYGWFEVPRAAVPIQSATFEFVGEYKEVEGHFYFFHSPAHLADLVLGEMVHGRVTQGAGTFSVFGYLESSKALRLDIPDFQPQPLELRRLVLRTAFAAESSVAFGMFVLSLGAAVGVLIWPTLTRLVRRTGWTEIVLAMLLIGIKLLLSMDLNLSLASIYGHDDALFVGQAASIMGGKWLGHFGHLTLAKGPVFPLFLAAVGESQCRLQVAQALLHALACVAFVLALKPVVSSGSLRLLLFAVLLFDPHTLSASATGRVLRSGIQPALVLLSLAGVIGLATRVNKPSRQMVVWSFLSGIAISAFWFCREEGVWLIPSVAVVLIGGVGAVLGTDSKQKVLRLALLLFPLFLVYVATWSLRLVNSNYYGAAVTVDVKDGAFPEAYAALVRVNAPEYIPGVPVSKATRLLIYGVSPAFAELQPMLEGWVGDGWSLLGWEGIDHPSAKKEIRGGWFQWALRQAADAAGHYKDAHTADEYWRQVATEVNAACDAGLLSAGPRRHGFSPRWNASLNKPLLKSLVVAAKVVTQFSDFRLEPESNRGTPESLEVFRRVTHEAGIKDHRSPTRLSKVRAVIFAAYHSFGAIGCIAAILATLFMLVRALRVRDVILECVVLISLFGGALALIVIVSLVDVTSFTAAHAGYLSPATPLVLAFSVLAPWWAWNRCNRDGTEVTSPD